MLSEAKIKPLTTLKLFSRGILKPNKGVYLLKDNSNLQQVEEPISKGVSKAYKSPVKTAERSEEYSTHPPIKRKPKIGEILSPWERFQKKRRLKLLNQDFNFKLREKYP